MNERFTLECTAMEIAENERVNKKLPLFFDLELCRQLKWPFSKMKLKNMMKMTKFPGRELMEAANFILERREAGKKITIPIWRGLPENEADAAESTVLIPFVCEDDVRPVVLICPEWSNGRQRLWEEGMPVADRLVALGCQCFILNLRENNEADDMARAIRFLRANHQKLHLQEDRMALLAFGEMKGPARKLYFHSKRIKDVTHRYDALPCEPDELWIIGAEDEDADKAGIFFSGDLTVSDDSDSAWIEKLMPWLEERITAFQVRAVTESKGESEA